jgi:hypothetical protein
MIKADPEYYQSLQKELITNNRWFTIALVGFNFCIAMAFGGGSPTVGTGCLPHLSLCCLHCGRGLISNTLAY